MNFTIIFILLYGALTLLSCLGYASALRRIRRIEDRQNAVRFVSKPDYDPLEDQKLLARLLNAKKKYCMDYNKENGLYCQHSKGHKYWYPLSSTTYKHKTHQNGDVRWAMVKKEKS